MSILSLLPVIEGGSSRPMGDVTWNLEQMRGEKISGMDSLCQSIRLALEVPRYRYPIYSPSGLWGFIFSFAMFGMF